MICDFCGKEYEEADGVKACSRCSMFGGCQMLKCPHCGYETPRETKLVKRIKRWKAKRKRTTRP
jgi:hypothetical protein